MHSTARKEEKKRKKNFDKILSYHICSLEKTKQKQTHEITDLIIINIQYFLFLFSSVHCLLRVEVKNKFKDVTSRSQLQNETEN